MLPESYPASESEFGRFTPDGREYVITEPRLMRPWVNFMANRRYSLWLSHTAGGFSMFNQDVRVHYYNSVKDEQGKWVYLRDDDTGDFWNVSWQPAAKDLDEWRCRHGLNYSIIESKQDGVFARQRVMLTTGDPVEIWTVTLRNDSDRKRRLSVFPYCAWQLASFIRADNAHMWFQTSDWLEDEGCILAEYRDPHRLGIDFKGFMASSAPVEGYECSERAFLGRFYHAYAAPKAVEDGRLSNSRGYSEQCIGVLHHKVELAPGQEKRIEIVIGFEPDAGARKRYIEKYADAAAADEQFRLNAEHWDDMIERLHVVTGDGRFDRMVNVRLKYQIWMGALWCRSGSFRFGFRDILQDIRGVLALDPAYTRERFLEPVRYQYADGHAVRQWSRTSDNHDTRMYMDSPLWITYTLQFYLKETADRSILDEVVPYFDGDGGEDTVYEHALKGINHVYSSRGEHGLCLIKGGDVNDAFDRVGPEGRGESVWLTQWLARNLLWMAEIAEWTGDDARAAECRSRYDEVAAAVNEHGWDGEWYLRCYDDEGKKIGSAENAEGSLHLLPQVTGILAETSTPERAEVSMRQVDERLQTDFGPKLFTPPYVTKDDRIGQFTSLTGFMNGGVYVHFVAYTIAAYVKMGRADDAWRTWLAVDPTNPAMKPKGARCEPFAITNCYLPPDTPRAGEAEIAWVTGSTSWLFYLATEWIPGVVPDFDGLRIRPCLPSHLKRFFLRREFRGAVYEVTIEREGDGGGNELRSITVDGEEVPGDLIEPRDGGTHEVLVKIG